MPTKQKKIRTVKSLLIQNAVLLDRVQAVFIARGWGELPMVKKAAKALEEWCDNNEAKVNTRHPVAGDQDGKEAR